MPSSSHVNRKVFFCGAESMLPYSQKLSKLGGDGGGSEKSRGKSGGEYDQNTMH